jgi:hypothetical protein
LLLLCVVHGHSGGGGRSRGSSDGDGLHWLAWARELGVVQNVS